jgi:hypothetical protein
MGHAGIRAPGPSRVLPSQFAELGHRGVLRLFIPRTRRVAARRSDRSGPDRKSDQPASSWNKRTRLPKHFGAQAYSWGSSLTWRGHGFEVGAYARLYLTALAGKLPANPYVAATGKALNSRCPPMVVPRAIWRGASLRNGTPSSGTAHARTPWLSTCPSPWRTSGSRKSSCILENSKRM